VLNSATCVTVIHVPYRGGGQAMQDLIAGRIDYQCALLPIAIPQIQSGSVKAIALLSRERSRTMPALATAREQGLADVDVSNWSAFFLPKGTPPAIVQKLRDATVVTMNTSAIRAPRREWESIWLFPSAGLPNTCTISSGARSKNG
jgi:tripartite-type tricarboxylate transporter receptor subunit TctC